MAGRAAANQAADRTAQEARISALEDAQQQPQVPEPRAAAAPADADVFSQLSELVRMHERGALNDEEFAAAKARLLG